MASIEPPEGEASGGEEEGIHSFNPFLVHSTDGTVVADYPVGVFLSGDLDSAIAVPTVVVTIIDSQLLVAVPGTAWHRLRNSRLLPPDCLQKPIVISVAGAKELDREIVEEGVDIKVWLGLLKNSYLPCLSFEAFDADHFTTEFKTEQGDSGFVPFADGLVAAADEKFSFLTAGEGSEHAEEGAGTDSTALRLAKLEENMVAIKMAMDKLVKATPSQDTRHSKAAPAAVAAPLPPARIVKADGGFPGLDPQAVQAALASGIDAAHLQELAKVLAKDKPKLGDTPGARTRRPKKVDILGDSEEEEVGAEAEEVAVPADGDPLAQAVVKLTNIMSALTRKKKPKAFEELLDDSAGILDQSSSSSTMGGARKHATLLKNLRKAMRESPEDIYRVIESRMESDFGAPEIAPGSTKQAGTFRGWTEHRSKIPNLGATVRTAWTVAGALDSLRLGKVAEAQAKLSLFLCQLDQVAVDRGQWLLAAEGGLEDPPPFSSFNRHQPPDLLEPQHTRLWPTQWAEAFMHRVKEQDEFIERRQKLGKRGFIGGGGLKTEDGEGKGAGKKGKKKGQQTEAPPPTNQ